MQFIALALLSGSLLTFGTVVPSSHSQQFAETAPVKAFQSTLTAPMQVGNEQNLHRGSGRREFLYQAETGRNPA
ncbi:hypothetical protein ACN4EK_16300 [Pantanalinema rosaneae CENA516]|uniref:hypothetical protein n=1 Tax=Pantanalinema rosaneae TaxID=1620701 RepID=UPI003D6DB4E5